MFLDNEQLTRKIKKAAAQLGFDAVGCAPAGEIPPRKLETWLERGFQGKMAYLERNREKRLSPELVLPGVRSVLCLALNYYHDYPLPYDEPERAVISRYASGDDYHHVIEKKLKELLTAIEELRPGTRGRFYVDTGPVLDKYWAGRSGLGWLGKHTNLLSKTAGSWFFLAEVLLDIELQHDEAAADHCGTCTRCIDACPTEAIVEPYVLDSRLCISYLSIELREGIPEALRPKMGNLVFGCDICQDVCPWNGKAPHSTVEELAPRPFNRAPDLKELSRLSEEQFRERFQKSPIKRTKWRGFLRNVCIAMGNSKDPSMLEDLKRLASSADPLVREHARWAIGTIRTKKNRGLPAGFHADEKDEVD